MVNPHDMSIDKIDKKYVHKAKEENVVIGNVYRFNNDNEEIFECNMIFDNTLPFFFEHFIDHVPGLLVIEGMRQMGTAVGHLFFDVDDNHFFIIDYINTKFTNFIELRDNVSLQMTMIRSETVKQKANCKTFFSKAYAIQNNSIVAEAESQWRCISKKIMERIRTRQNKGKIMPQACIDKGIL